MTHRAVAGKRLNQNRTVRDDWRSWLSTEKALMFESLTTQLECPYSMLSVYLNEAIELRKCGQHWSSWQVVGVTEELCERMVRTMSVLLTNLVNYAKHYGIVPIIAPLNPDNFHGRRRQRLARTNSLLCRVLLSERSQFLHKMATLDEMVTDFGKEFCESADELASRTTLDTESAWNALDINHYDLNTCLRETVVLLKSFLIALPESQLEEFKKALWQCQISAVTTKTSSARVFAHRRIEQIAAE